MKSFFSAAHIVLLQKAWQAFAGLVTVGLVTHFLSLEEQGYYYAIGGLMSSFLVLDLGLSGLLVQVSARMFPGLSFGAGGQLQPDGAAKQAFLQMLAWCRRWYARAGVLTLLLVPLGYAYFSASIPGEGAVGWRAPWVVVVVCAAVSMSALPLQAVLEGAGQVAEVYLLRLCHYAVGAFAAWALLWGGLGLFAPAMAPFAVALLTYAWAFARYPRLLRAPRPEQQAPFPWREQVWPLQKRVALTWAASYAFLNAPTLVAFYFLDAAAAGRLGLTMVVANLLGSLCVSWLIAKTPHITQLVASGEQGLARAIFVRELIRAYSLMALGYGALAAAVLLASQWAIILRFLPPLELLMLAGAFIVFHGIGMLAVYFRALGHERLAIPMVVATVLATTLAVLAAPHAGLMGICAAFLATFVFICVPMMALAWRFSPRGDLSPGATLGSPTNASR